MRGSRPVIMCDADDGMCGAWDVDAYAETVSSIDGHPVTAAERVPGWTSTKDDEDYCPEHKDLAAGKELPR